MQPETLELFHDVLNNNTDAERLEKARDRESEFITSKIDFVLQQRQVPRFDVSSFKSEFRNSNPKARLDQVVFTTLLFFTDVKNNEDFKRTLTTPSSLTAASQCSEHLLKIVIYAVLNLAYDVKWKAEHFFELDRCIRGLSTGKALHLREFCKSLGISVSPEIFPCEQEFTNLHFHSKDVFGPYFWRLLHWIAEAFETRSETYEVVLAKSLWRDFIQSSMYRFLQCLYCMNHFLSILPEFKARIANSSEFAKIFYEMHNRVNQENYLPIYSESEFEEDRRFMRAVWTK